MFGAMSGCGVWTESSICRGSGSTSRWLSSTTGWSFPRSRMAIALYGGTFDPIHHGHLILARDAIEQLGIDRVIFIPAAISPHKLERAPSPAAVRSGMVAAAIAGEERFAQDDRELHRAGPSFTVE